MKTIAIVGRPNVGKSTLFNRFVGRRRALVHDMPGVTRDRLEETTQWWVGGKSVEVKIVDTGGMGGDNFAKEIEFQVQAALKTADAVVIVFDGQDGVTPGDREVVKKLRQSGIDKKIPVIAAVNKVDAHSHEEMISDFYSLGLDPIVTTSAEHGRGISDLTDLLAEKLGLGDEASPPDGDEEIEESSGAPARTGAKKDDYPKVAIVGRPNVGKSTLTNALLGENRMITSPIAGTTVDAVDSLAELNGKKFWLIDTAGIRRKSRTEQGVEVLSVVQARKALERADVAILLLDGEEGVTDQDEKIGGIIEEIGCSVILAVNKWDLQAKKKDFTRDDAADLLRDKMGYLKYAPILFLSAKNKRGYENLGDLVEEILHQRQLKLPTHEFTEWVRKEATIHNPKNVKFFMSHQSGRNPPTFVCHVSDPEKVHFSLKRHLLNALRERWGYMGTPVRLLFVKGKNK